MTEQENVSAEEVVCAELPDNMPVAEPEGENVSPNGRLEVRTVGAGEHYVSGVVVPEAIQIVDRETGEVKWEDRGYLWQSVSWSPGNNLVALAYGGRTWTAVRVICTLWWTSWDFTLPDGSPIPEYTFLPEDWGEWLDEETMLLTVDRGGDREERHIYRCHVNVQSNEISSSVQEHNDLVAAYGQ